MKRAWHAGQMQAHEPPPALLDATPKARPQGMPAGFGGVPYTPLVFPPSNTPTHSDWVAATAALSPPPPLFLLVGAAATPRLHHRRLHACGTTATAADAAHHETADATHHEADATHHEAADATHHEAADATHHEADATHHGAADATHHEADATHHEAHATHHEAEATAQPTATADATRDLAEDARLAKRRAAQATGPAQDPPTGNAPRQWPNGPMGQWPNADPLLHPMAQWLTDVAAPRGFFPMRFHYVTAPDDWVVRWLMRFDNRIAAETAQARRLEAAAQAGTQGIAGPSRSTSGSPSSLGDRLVG